VFKRYQHLPIYTDCIIAYNSADFAHSDHRAYFRPCELCVWCSV